METDSGARRIRAGFLFVLWSTSPVSESRDGHITS